MSFSDDDDLSSLSSALSSPPESDNEQPVVPQKKLAAPRPKKRKHKTINDMFARQASPPPREPSPLPEHEYVLADNPDIAVIVMFRARFSNAIPAKLPNFGPQDLEQAVVDQPPAPLAENMLCALLLLVLNRKQMPERKSYGRALEEAIQTHKHEWPKAWNGVSPVKGENSFITMNPEERLNLLRTIIHWCLGSSKAIRDIIAAEYAQQRHNDDANQPLAVQPWGKDYDKAVDHEKSRYWFIEGLDDTQYRVYREMRPGTEDQTWWNVGGGIEDLRALADSLEQKNTQAARKLQQRITAAIPHFEATDAKRKRRSYRLTRSAQFTRPNDGLPDYTGRTRGKRPKYTYYYDGDDGTGSEGYYGTRRSTRHAAAQSGVEDTNKPTVTASGRQVRSRVGGMYGESLVAGQRGSRESTAAVGTDGDMTGGELDGGRRTRSLVNGRGRPRGRRNIEDFEDEDDEDDASSTGRDWDANDDEYDDNMDQEKEDAEEEEENEEATLDEEDDELFEKPTLLVKLPYRKGSASGVGLPPPQLRESKPVEVNHVDDQKENTEPPLANGIHRKTEDGGVKDEPMQDVQVQVPASMQPAAAQPNAAH